jgi:hypothetical protein
MSDDFSAAIDQVQAPKAQQDGDDFSGVIDVIDQNERAAAKANTFTGQASDPDQAAKAMDLSKQTGVPASVVEPDVQTYEQQQKFANAQKTLDANPGLRSWIAHNPMAARVAHDDFDKLGTLDKMIQSTSAGWGEGVAQDALSRVGWKELSGDTSSQTSQQEKDLQDKLSRPDGVDDGFYKAVKGISSFFGSMAPQINFAGKTAVVGATAGSMVPGIGTAIGGGAGFVAGMVKEGFETGAGNLYVALKNQKDENGNQLDPNIAKGAALIGGLALGALNGGAVEAGTKPFKDMMQSIIPDLANKLVSRPTMGKALANVGATMGKSAASGAAFGALAQTINVTAEQVAKSVDGGKWATVFNSGVERDKALDSIVDSAEQMALVFPVMHALPASIGLAGDLSRAREAATQHQFMQGVMDGTVDSKTWQRSKDTFQNFMASQLPEGHPAQNVLIPAEHIQRFYQSEGIKPGDANDPFHFQKDIGEQLQQAAPISGDVVIPMADYTTHLAGTETDAAMRPAVKFDNGMSINDLKQFQAENKEALVGMADKLGSTVKDPIEGDVAKQLEETGYKPRTAGGMAKQMAAFFNTIGERVGVNPVELFNKYALKIEKSKGEAPEGAMKQTDTHTVVDGESRSRYNSAGRLIHPTEKGIENFWKQHGDHAVTDDMGRPKVFYHGTAQDISQFRAKQAGAIFLTEDPDFAHSFSNASESWMIDNAEKLSHPDDLQKATLSAINDVIKTNWGLSKQDREARLADLENTTEYKKRVSDTLPSRQNIVPLYAKAKNPFDYMDESHVDALMARMFKELHDPEYERGDNLAKENAMRALRNAIKDSNHNWGTIERADVQESIRAMGHDGFYVAEAGRRNLALYDNTAVKSAIGNSGEFSAKDAQILRQGDERGYITIGGDKKMSITMLENANLSTFLHESGHMYLEVLKDLMETGKGGALKDDIDVILKHLGAKDLGSITEAQHEVFARSFEAYLMEGKAPSRGLEGAFSRFKGWLTTIYKKASNLQVNLSPEIRQTFDRLLATDKEILNAKHAQRMEALFSDAKAAGMTDAEFAAYRKAVTGASAEANKKLLAKTMEDIKRQRTIKYQEQKARVQVEQKAKVEQRPDIRTLSYLRTGKMPDGAVADGAHIPPHMLDKNEIARRYGPEALSDMPAGTPGHPLVGEGGIHPDDLAEQMGFNSGDAMIKALISLEKRQRALRVDNPGASIKQHMIDTATEQIMKDKYGDMLEDGTIKDEAIAALHNDRQAEVLSTELNALARTKGIKATPLKVAKAWAKKAVMESKVGDVTKSWKYARAEETAARAVQKALLSGDHDEALRQQQIRMLNHVMFMAARDAGERVDIIQRSLNKYGTTKAIKSVDPDYMDQVHDLLERFNFRQMSGPKVGKLESLRAWVDGQRSKDEEVIDVPDKLLDNAYRQHYTRMQYGDLLKLNDLVENIIHLGKLKNTLLDGAERRELSDAAAEAASQLSNLKQKDIPTERNPGVGGRGLDKLNAKWIKLKAGIRGMDASLVKMEQLFQWLDQYDQNGVFQRLVFKRFSEAQGKENSLRAKVATHLNEVIRNMPEEVKSDWLNRYDLPELTDSKTGKPSSMLKSEIVAMAMNMGSESNMDKMLRGEKWGQKEVEAVLDRHMSKHDWDYVREVWKSLHTLWPEIQAMERRLTGSAPEAVEPRTVSTRYGDFEGGYYPIVYDPNRSWQTELNKQRSAESMFENNYTKATTPKGHTIEREAQYAAPLLLSMDVLPRHVLQVIHDLSWREPIMDADRFLSRSEIREGVEKSMGIEYYKQFRPWLQAIANDKVFDERGLAWWDSMAHKARTTATMVGLGFRATTMLIHGSTALSNSIGELGPKWMASGAHDFFGSMDKMKSQYEFITSRSDEMRHRMETSDRDIRDGLQDLVTQRRDGKISNITYQARKYAYFGISALDMASALPTWLGAYNKAMAKAEDGGLNKSEADAVYYADQAVRNAHGASGVKDLPAVMRGPEFMKLFTMFYTFWSHFYNRERDMARRGLAAGDTWASGNKKQAAKDFTAVLGRSIFYFAIPQMIHAALKSQTSEDKNKEYVERAMEEMGQGLFAGVPVARDVSRSVLSGAEFEATPAANMLKSFINTGKDFAHATGLKEGEVDKNWVKNEMQTAGYSLGLPLGQPSSSAQYLWDVMHGDQQPQDVADWTHGLIYGKQKE